MSPSTTTMIQATINGLPVEVAEGSTILEAARQVSCIFPRYANIRISIPRQPAASASSGLRTLPRCCVPVALPLEEKMEITTEDPEIIQVRRSVVEMMLSKHPNECLTCGRSRIVNSKPWLRISECALGRLENLVSDLPIDTSTRSITLDPRKCITCGRCIRCRRIRMSGHSVSCIAALRHASPQPGTSRWVIRRVYVADNALLIVPPERSWNMMRPYRFGTSFLIPMSIAWCRSPRPFAWR